MKKLLIFDLDGTLAESKSAVDEEMAGLLADLTEATRVSIISGGAWPQFREQVVGNLPKRTRFANLLLLPTCGTKFYSYRDGWRLLYSEDFRPEQKSEIIAALNDAFAQAGLEVAETWGEQIEDRGGQITFSALGQLAPLEKKKLWDADFAKRQKLKECLIERIPHYSIRLGGATSIDVTRAGIDKGHGIRKLAEFLAVDTAEMLYVGDALFPGGNDYPAKAMGLESIEVRDVSETKHLI